MSKNPFPNPYHQQRSIGEQGTPKLRGLVVNIQDPLKAGRVQVRVHGAMDDEIMIPDDKLPWVKVEGSTATGSFQNYTGTHGLIPGTEVFLNKFGEAGQDYVITSTIPNDRKDGQQSIHPATQGKGETDNIWGTDAFSTAMQGDGSFGWGVGVHDILYANTTREARRLRDETNRKNRRTREPMSSARDESPAGGSGEKRRTSKDPKGGSIGAHKFDSSQDVQKFIQQNIQNRSAIVKNALPAIQQLMKVNGNPTSIQSIGAGNFSSILSQLGSLFNSGGSTQQNEKIFDCEQLRKIPDSHLTAEQLVDKRRCELIEQELYAKQIDVTEYVKIEPWTPPKTTIIDLTPSDPSPNTGNGDEGNTGGAVDSVNGKTGVVELIGDDIPFNNTGTSLTAIDIQNAIVQVDANNSDLYSNVSYALNEINSITSDISFITSNISSINSELDDLANTVANIANVSEDIENLETNKVNTSRLINTTGLISGGGDLTADRTLNVSAATANVARAGSNTTVVLTPQNLTDAITRVGSAAFDISGNTVTPDLSIGSNFTLAVSNVGSFFLANPSAVVNSRSGVIIIDCGSNDHGFTVDFGSAWRWENGEKPTLPSSRYSYLFYYTHSSFLVCRLVGNVSA